jgi:hypothetical protein
MALGWQGLSVTNTPAYYVTETITTVKSFIVHAPIFISGGA